MRIQLIRHDSMVKSKKAYISISVGDKEIFSTDTQLDNENFNTTIEYSGKAQVTIVITDENNGKWTRTQYVDFSKDTIIEFEKIKKLGTEQKMHVSNLQNAGVVI